jgi:hypothetical protein
MFVKSPYVLGLFVLAQTQYALTAPVASTSTRPLYETFPDYDGVTIYFSNLNDTIFGEDAASFDYHVVRDKRLSIESIQHLAKTQYSEDAHSVLLAVTNATLLGMVTAEQGANNTWLCNELGADMARHSVACDDINIMPTVWFEDEDAESDALVKRGRWTWIKHTAHYSSTVAMELLHRSLGNEVNSYFANSPRDFCEKLDGVRACLSWSQVERFDHYYARVMLEDALSVTDFNRYSVIAKNILGNQKRSLADVCFSDRPKGCT